MTDLERDSIESNYPTYSDIVKIAQSPAFYPMDGQLHLFIERLCVLCGWPQQEMFQRIFKEWGETTEKI